MVRTSLKFRALRQPWPGLFSHLQFSSLAREPAWRRRMPPFVSALPANSFCGRCASVSSRRKPQEPAPLPFARVDRYTAFAGQATAKYTSGGRLRLPLPTPPVLTSRIVPSSRSYVVTLNGCRGSSKPCCHSAKFRRNEPVANRSAHIGS